LNTETLRLPLRRRLGDWRRRAIEFGGRCLQAPGTVYATVYIALRLNRLYHGLGLRAEWQLWLLPRRLWVSRRLMSQPYRLPTRLIQWGGRPPGGEARVGPGLGNGFVFDGDWDLADKRPLGDYLADYIYSRTVLQMFEQQLPYTQTDQYREMSATVRAGAFGEWQARGCRSEADIARYFDGLRATFEAIRAQGYSSQAQLGSPRWYDEIKLFVDRNGEFHKLQGAGHHRRAMVRLLKVESSPAIVLGVHRQWALAVQRRRGRDLLTSIDEEIRGMVGERTSTG
jgi:hypothetical protein